MSMFVYACNDAHREENSNDEIAGTTEMGDTAGTTEMGDVIILHDIAINGTGGTTEAGDTAGTTEAGDTGGTTEAGDTAGTTEAGETAGTTEAGDTAGTTEAGDTAGTTEAGDTAGTTEAGDTAGSEDLTTLWDGGIVPGSTDESWVVSHGTIPCQIYTVLSPAIPEEANHFAATRITVPFTPFLVTHIYYDLFNSEMTASCTPSLAHEVQLFVINANDALPTAPSADAILYQIIQVEADPSRPEARRVRLILDTPILLETNQSLVVSVQMKLEGEQHLCMGYCNDRRTPAGTQFWSSSATEPYPWTDLTSFGFNEAYTILVEGTPM